MLIQANTIFIHQIGSNTRTKAIKAYGALKQTLATTLRGHSASVSFSFFFLVSRNFPHDRLWGELKTDLQLQFRPYFDWKRGESLFTWRQMGRWPSTRVQICRLRTSAINRQWNHQTLEQHHNSQFNRCSSVRFRVFRRTWNGHLWPWCQVERTTFLPK